MITRKQRAFKKTALALAVAAATGVNAQESAGSMPLEEIVVTGVRGSLSQSLDIKRDAKAIVDSIRAEELGRFPDDNVAESLSRIPGITVSRNRGGEADYINIRGLGPEFSVVTLNNRILATDDTGRNLAFDVLPSEMIGGADVWKTSLATNVEGSIGGAVNLKSLRPLDMPGFQSTVSLKGDHNSLSEETGTKFAGVLSNTFADDTFGVVVGVTRESGTRRADEMFDNYFFGVGDDFEYDLNGDLMISADEQNLVVPGSYALGSYASDFERTGITTTFQWRPSDRVELTADILVTELQADATGFTQSFYMVDENRLYNPATGEVGIDEETGLLALDDDDNPIPADSYYQRFTNITTDGNVITGMDVSDVAMEVVTLDDHRTVDTAMFGLNGKFQVSDDLAVTADIYRSSSERNSGGKNTFVVAQSPGAHSGRYDLNEGGLPDYIPNWADRAEDGGGYTGRTSDEFGNEDFGPHWAARDGDDIEDTVTGFSLAGDLELNLESLTSIDFGVSFTGRDKTRLSYNNYDAGACQYCGAPYFFDQTGVDNEGNAFDINADVVRPFPYDNLFDGESGNIPRSFPIFDIPGYGAGLAASDGLSFGEDDDGNPIFLDATLWAPVLNPVDSYDISEDTTAFFVQGNFEGDEWFANIGTRLVKTDVTAKYSYNEILSIEIVDPLDPNPEWIVEYSDSAAQTDKGDYTKLLTSANFGMYLQDDLLLRAAFGQSMSRPTIDQLAPLTTDNAQSGVFEMSITGNPDIQPVFADQLDVGLEWYFGDDSLLFGAVFWKDLDGFITNNTTERDIAGETFRVTQPINGDSAEVLGLELGVQTFFDNGFGVAASYGYTDSSTIVDGEDAGSLVGLADTSYSLSLIYEKDKISSQISYDYTGSLVADAFSPLGDGYNTTKDSVSMVTASFRYDVTDQAQVFVEGVNLLDESNRTFQGRSDLPSNIQVYGRTINFGARYSF